MSRKSSISASIAATDTPAGQRGPLEHERRDQIIREADEHFRRNGYSQTSVAELAKAIGVSSAYVYRFFDSKQAIGEAVCRAVLARMAAALWEIAQRPNSASQRIRLLVKALKNQGQEQYFKQRALHDIVSTALRDHWPSVLVHRYEILQVVRKVVGDGRQSGEFERKTPLDETCLAIFECLMPFAHPLLLELRTPEELDVSVVAVTNLVLRSLAP